MCLISGEDFLYHHKPFSSQWKMQCAEHFLSECEKLESLREILKLFSQLNIFFIHVTSVVAVLNSHACILNYGKIAFSSWWISVCRPDHELEFKSPGTVLIIHGYLTIFVCS